MPRSSVSDPWEKTRVGELGDPLLPRWFAVTAVALVPVAVAVLVVALWVPGRGHVPVAERRPPPAGGLTHAVGDFVVGDAEPVTYAQACPMLEGVRVAGESRDLSVLRTSLAALCNTRLDEATEDRLRRFAAAGGVVRFAAFEATGVDSTARVDAEPPLILVNARFSRTDPLWVAPLVAHDVTFLDEEAARASGALTARRVEADVCARVLAGRGTSRGCRDAEELLSLPDPVLALRAAGFK
jgi:hypothetical protein